MTGGFDWVDKQEEKSKEERGKEYFDIREGKQQFVLLSHCAPFAQVFDGKKYRPAEEGDKNISIKGVCWVLQYDPETKEPLIKQAKLPYTVVKTIRGIQQDPEWDFKIPFPHVFTLDAVGAGMKEVKYSLTPSPKLIVIPAEVLEELKKKPSPDDMVERLKGKEVSTGSGYPTSEDEGINTNETPW